MDIVKRVIKRGAMNLGGGKLGEFCFTAVQPCCTPVGT